MSIRWNVNGKVLDHPTSQKDSEGRVSIYREIRAVNLYPKPKPGSTRRTLLGGTTVRVFTAKK